MENGNISNKVILKNASINLAGQIAVLIVGVLTIPYIITGMGNDRFGIFSIVIAVMGYCAIFDLGLGKATTKFVSEAIGKGTIDEISEIIGTIIFSQAGLGIVGALTVAGLTSFFVEHVFNIPIALIGEAKASFYLLSVSVPVVLIASGLRGVLEAMQRFDLVNYVKIPSDALLFIFALFGVFLGLRLPAVIAAIIFTRFGGMVAYAFLNFRHIAQFKKISISFKLLPRFFTFGGWVTISGVVGPVLVYLDRFLIASIISMGALTYYSAPYEAVTRLAIIPASLSMTLFPAFSTLEGRKNMEKVESLFERSLKFTLLVVGPISLMIGLFAQELLNIWLGTEFALRSTSVLQVLAFGVFANSLALTPYVLLQGLGRPDIPAKFHLIELPIYVVIAWFLISTRGIFGAAVAWSLRVVIDALLLLLASHKINRISLQMMLTRGTVHAFVALFILGFATYFSKILVSPAHPFIQFILIGLFLILFFWISWKSVLDISEREFLRKFLKVHGDSNNGI